MSEAAYKLERVRRLAKDLGVPLNTVDHLAIAIPRAAELLQISPKALRKLLQEDKVPVIDLGRGNDRIDVIDLIEFMESRKVIRPGPRASNTRAVSKEVCRRLDEMTGRR